MTFALLSLRLKIRVTDGSQTEVRYLGLGHSHMAFPEKKLAIQIADVYRIQVNLQQHGGAFQLQNNETSR